MLDTCYIQEKPLLTDAIHCQSVFTSKAARRYSHMLRGIVHWKDEPAKVRLHYLLLPLLPPPGVTKVQRQTPLNRYSTLRLH